MTVPLSPSPQQQYPRSPSYSPSPQQRSPSTPQQEGDDGGSMSVRVAVRARPLVEKELVERCSECVAKDGKQVVLGKDRRFTFDHVFGPGVSQEEVYNDCVKPLVESCCGGYNATVLAYGQTGSGKTFTMGCGNTVPLLEEELGILPRAIRQLFECVEDRSNQAEFLIRCAYVEIYNEEIKDLLHPETPSKSISIREDASGNIILAGVKEEVVTNFESMIKFLENGSVHRTTGSTLMNQHSSRSHAIFTIIVEQRSILECANSSEVITAKFHLVDLAGSERAKRTGAVGMRFKESVTINCGLLALGNVISALGDEQKRCQHVPYRESKLTRMLQDSLGGNSRTCMIACVSTADLNYEETLNTLKYANRARNIRNKPVINRDPHSALLSQLRQEIRALQMELLNSRMRNIGLEPVTGSKGSEILLQDETQQELLADIRARQDTTSVDVTAEIDSVRRTNTEKEHECLKLKDEIQELQSLVGRLEEEMSEVCMERDNYQRKLEEVNSEMTALVQVLPHWEDVSPAAKSQLHEMMKRVTGEIENELGPGFTSSSESSFSSVDRPLHGFLHGRRSADKERSGRGSPLSSEIGSPRRTSRGGRPALQPEDFLPSSPRGSPTRADLAARGCNSPGGTTRATRNIINQHLRTIRVLEERLAVKESDAKLKEEALKEATEDLVRDERIFAEKMNEIKTLKQLARDLTFEKEILVQKVERDTKMISLMSEDALAKEDELGRLRTSLGQVMSKRPGVFVINGARVPKGVTEDASAKEDELGHLRTSLGMSGCPDAFVINGGHVPKEDALAKEDEIGCLRSFRGMSGCPDAYIIKGARVPKRLAEDALANEDEVVCLRTSSPGMSGCPVNGPHIPRCVSEDGLAKEDDLGRFQTSLYGMSGCLDAFVMNGAHVPRCVPEDALAKEDELSRLQTSSLGMSRSPIASDVCVPRCVLEVGLTNEDESWRLRTSQGMFGCPDTFDVNGMHVPRCVLADGLAKDDLGRLQTSSLATRSECPDAFVVSGACVAMCVSEDALAKEDDLDCLRTSLVMNGDCVPGVPVALMKPKSENKDCPTDDNNDYPDEVMTMSLKNVPGVPVALMKPKAENKDCPTKDNSDVEAKVHALDYDSDGTADTVDETHPEDLSEKTKVCLFSTTAADTVGQTYPEDLSEKMKDCFFTTTLAADTVGQTHPEDFSEKMKAEKENETEKASLFEEEPFEEEKPWLVVKDVEEGLTGKKSKRRKQKSGFFSKCLSGR